MADQQFKPDKSLRFSQIVAFDIGDVDQVYGLDMYGHVWYYCWREEAWFPLKMRKGRERSEDEFRSASKGSESGG